MVRKSLVNGNRAGAEGSEDNRHVPPSTLTAQIVEHHAQADGQHEHQDKATFGQLLDEIRTNPTAVEADVQSNYKLIGVVADAGFDTLDKIDPFAEQDERLAQIIACVEVIEIAVQRNPEVLFYTGTGTNGQGSQLCLWLLPKIFAAMKYLSDGNIVRHLQRLLDSLLRFLRESSTLFADHNKLRRLYRLFVEDIFAGLQRYKPVRDDSDVYIILPSPEAREMVCGDSQQPVALNQGSQIQLRSQKHALVVLLSLTSAICSNTDATIKQNHLSSLNSSSQAWALQMMLKIWRKHLGSNVATHQSFESIAVAHFLKTLHLLCIASMQPQSCTVISQKTGLLVANCVAHILARSVTMFSYDFQEELSHLLLVLKNLCRRSGRILQEARDHLLPIAATVANDETQLRDLSSQLQTVIKSLPHFFATSTQCFATNSSGTKDDAAFSSDKVHELFNSTGDQNGNSDRPNKKVKLDLAVKEPQNSLPEGALLLDELCSLLGKRDSKDLEDLCTTVEQVFSTLPDKEKRQVLDILTKIPCSGVRTALDPAGSMRLGLCECSFAKKSSDNTTEWDERHWKLFKGILKTLIESSALQASKECRVLVTNAVRTFTCHTPILEHKNLVTSPLGKWCMQSLRSSLRELRIAAGLAIPSFLRDERGNDVNVCRKNRFYALDFLRQISASSDPKYCETLILALGQIAGASGDEEMNIVLLRLIEYLGHTNPIISGMAHVELRRLAQIRVSSVEELLKPFWRSIAITVVKDLISKPQKVQQLSDVMGLNINQFLVLTQAETLPYLVLWKEKEILERIAKARDTTLWSLCMQPRNLAAILSLLIVQQPAEFESSILSCLSHASPEFQNEDIANLLKIDPISVACEVLKYAGDEDESNRNLTIEAFRDFTVAIERRGHQSKAPSTQARMAALFFETHALGIMASFSDIIDSPSQAPIDKKRSLRAIEQMVLAAQDNIRVALPQIRACLQSAMEDHQLRDYAFSAWTSLLMTLEMDEDLESFIEQTFTVLVQNWESFPPSLQQKAHDAVATLLKNHSALIQSTVASIPSLHSIPLMSKFESQLSRLRNDMDVSGRLQAFSNRCGNENPTVVLQALRELVQFLNVHVTWIHQSAVTEQPSHAIATLVRALLDTCVRFKEDNHEILDLSTQCLGIIGCLDPNRVETVREKRDMVVLHNFTQANESVEFVAFLLENVLVKSFHSVSNPRAQGFLAYVMQELLKFCGFSKEATAPFRPQGSRADNIYQRWIQMPESVRSTLGPFLSSRYVLTTHSSKAPDRQSFPIFSLGLSHGSWLRTFVFDLLQRAKEDNAQMIFSVLSRIIRGYDIAISGFLLPFATANVILAGSDEEAAEIGLELRTVLEQSTQGISQAEAEHVKLCSEHVFQILDYLTKWLQEKKKEMATARNIAARSGRVVSETEEETDSSQIRSVEHVLFMIPADIISRRAVECGSYSRALFHWEQYMRQTRASDQRDSTSTTNDRLYQRLQDIYSQIEEPDGLEGISVYLHALSPDQQLLEHKRAGRWAAAQSWYELQLTDRPQDIDMHIELLDCLQRGGQHYLVLDHASTLTKEQQRNGKVLSIVSEAAWYTERWSDLETFLSSMTGAATAEFNCALGSTMVALNHQNSDTVSKFVRSMRLGIAKAMSSSNTSSVQACHEQLLKLHALCELEAISGVTKAPQPNTSGLQTSLAQRLDVLGSCLPDKQYLLGIRRAAMRLVPAEFSRKDVAASWMESAKLARKENWSSVAHDAVLHAAQLEDESAKIEQARLLWKGGEHRKAIQSLEGVIAANAFSQSVDGAASDIASFSTATGTTTDPRNPEQNLLLAKAHLLHAKWLDASGQTQSSVINQKYQLAARTYTKWEKGLYYLGRFYNKLHESEKALPTAKQNLGYLGGETAKLVVENYLRSLMFGCKYLFETMPKLLTLWLDFGVEVNRPIPKDVPDDTRTRAAENKPKMFEITNRQVKKYTEKIPAYLFYIALPQMITRMGHSNQKVYELLASIIVKVVGAHPQQGLWPLLAVVKSSAHDRASRGVSILNKLKEKGKNIRNEGQNVDLRSLVTQGQKLSDQLLHACEANIEGRSTMVSLTKDLGFNLKVAPCPLVVPLEQTLSASLPTAADNAQIKQHRAFPMSRDAITISSFAEEVLVLSSLQRPRKITVRGSDGHKYGLLCKPNDDLRKDQRLMEFNAMINRSLKKDAESSKRRLYIKTYAVTPLNEACGLIEWVDGLKPMRDILLSLYRSKGVKVDYNLLRDMLNEACATTEGYRIFSEQILPMYPPILHEWFTELFAEPESWFAARLRYTRSCAVTSMVGYALGLGDRHGENVLIEENSGGVFHVDFNCLFEKGFTFDKPEVVPFRLTHNMVDAFGVTGVEGSFRRSAECVMKVMRAKEDPLLTILETFLYDPTADFVGTRKKSAKGVPETPKEVLESVSSKVRGLMRGESVPLSVGGHVDALIRSATDPKNLCQMYIGWCAFL